MTVLIDIVGAPGVGKTTLVNHIIQLNNKSCEYVFAQDFIRVPRTRFIAKQLQKFPALAGAKYIKVLGGLLYRHPNVMEKETAIKEMPSAWQLFLHFCNEAFKPPGNGEFQIQETAVKWMLESAQERALIALSSESGKVILQDEPLTFRLSLFSRNETSSDKIENYFKCVPLPHGVIHLSSDRKTVIRRYLQRQAESGQVNIRHEGMNRGELAKDLDWSLEVAKRGVSILGKRGVPLLLLKAEEDLGENIQKVNSFVQEVEDNCSLGNSSRCGHDHNLYM